MTLTIAQSDSHRLWVFTINVTAAELATLGGPAAEYDPLAALLGVDAVDRKYVEVFDASDLTGLGLANYLAAGPAIPQAQLDLDRNRLNALQGPVLILFAAAFPQRPVTLHLDPRLTLIGTYAEEVPPIHFEPLPNAGTITKPAAKYSNARMSGMVATVALLVMFALVALMVWLA